MHVPKLLPAGIPQGLIRARYRIAYILSEAPVLFIAIVLGVALTFRFGIGAVRAASDPPAETAVSTSSHTQASAPHEMPRAAGGVSTAKAVVRDDDVLPSAPGASPIVRPALPTTTTTTTTAPTHRKPRAHGRR